jgi:hypothetical protein
MCLHGSGREHQIRRAKVKGDKEEVKSRKLSDREIELTKATKEWARIMIDILDVDVDIYGQDFVEANKGKLEDMKRLHKIYEQKLESGRTSANIENEQAEIFSRMPTELDMLRAKSKCFDAFVELGAKVAANRQ